MNRTEALEYLRVNHHGVLATVKRDGRPQLSRVSYMLDSDGDIKISVTNDRAKTYNARRDERVSLMAIGENLHLHQYIVAEGTAHIIDDDPLPLLRHVYQVIAGQPHPDWEEFDEAMVRDQRVVLVITIDRLYPLRD